MSDACTYLSLVNYITVIRSDKLRTLPCLKLMLTDNVSHTHTHLECLRTHTHNGWPSALLPPILVLLSSLPLFVLYYTLSSGQRSSRRSAISAYLSAFAFRKYIL